MSECRCSLSINAGIAMMAGDSWPLRFEIKVNGEPIDVQDVELIEFTVDELTKTYPAEVSYRNAERAFIFPLTQEETQCLSGEVKAQGRVKFSTGEVIGVDFGRIKVARALSKAVI